MSFAFVQNILFCVSQQFLQTYTRLKNWPYWKFSEGPNSRRLVRCLVWLCEWVFDGSWPMVKEFATGWTWQTSLFAWHL